LTKISGTVDAIESGSNPDPKQGCEVLNSTFYTLKPKKKVKQLWKNANSPLMLKNNTDRKPIT
jgi:hypothetical protein